MCTTLCPVNALRLAIGLATDNPAFMTDYPSDAVEAHRIEVVNGDPMVTVRVIGVDGSVIWSKHTFTPYAILTRRLSGAHGVGIFTDLDTEPQFEARVCTSDVHLTLTVHRR